MNRKMLVFGMMIALAFTGCKDAKTVPADESALEEDSLDVNDGDADEESMDELISEEVMPISAEELFDDFFFNFASNKHLQMERIIFPLKVESEAKSDTLEKQEWQMEHFFMHNEEYTLIFDNEQQMEQVKDTTIDHAVVEKIFLDQGFVCQYLFDRKNGRWMLDGMHKQTLSHNFNASFLAFYRRFATDSVFRQNSLKDEIAFSSTDPDNDFERMEGVITPDSWEAFAPEMPHGIIYNIVYGHHQTHSDTKIFVLRGIANGLEIEMTFHRQHNNWKLTKLSE